MEMERISDLMECKELST